MTKANANVKLLKTIPGIREFFSLPLTFNIHITSCLNMENGPRPVSCSGLLFADRSARRFVTAAIAVAIDTAARLTGIADQGTSHATNGGTHCRTAYIAGRHAADDGAGRSTDAGALFRLCASGERKDEHSCEEDVLHDWFLF
jgi:hypothetical protein